MDWSEIIISLPSLVIALAALWTIWGRKQDKKQDYSDRLTRVEIAQKNTSKWVDKAEPKIDGVSDQIDDKVSVAIDKLRKELFGWLKIAYPKTIFSIDNSPRVLNDYGKGLAEKSGIDEMIAKHRTEWFNALDGKVGYELSKECEAIAKAAIENPVNRDSLAQINNYFFEEGVPVDSVCDVLALRLREKYNTQAK